MKYIVYLHGFNSSPQSEKAQLTSRYFQHTVGSHLSILVPALPPSPLDAISEVQALINRQGRENLRGFIGSSLGGFYSLYLQHFYRSASGIPKTVLINPSVQPYNLLQDYIGENQNMYTGEKYTVKPSHMDDLKSLIVPPISSPKDTFLLTQTGDEVLDYQDAITYLKNIRIWVQFGGNHAFEHYSAVLPSIRHFFEMP